MVSKHKGAQPLHIIVPAVEALVAHLFPGAEEPVINKCAKANKNKCLVEVVWPKI